MRCHPARWLWGLIPIAMLSWLAVHVESGAIERDLERRSAAALSVAGHDWAVVAFSGRDGLLAGQPPDARQRDAAIAVVREVWGVRMVATRSAVPAPLDLPIVPIMPVAERNQRRVDLHDVAPTLTASEVSDVPPVMSEARVPLLAAEAPRMTVLARERRLSALDAGAVTPLAAPTSPADASMSAQSISPHEVTTAVALAPPPPEPKKSAAPPMNVTAASAPPAQSVDPGPVALLPERKPAEAPPAPVIAPAPTLPEPKIAAAAHPTPAPTSAASTARPPPLPVSRKAATASAGTPTRFETAALPQSNIDPNTPCMSGVRGAAHSVEVHFGRGHAGLDRSGKLLIDRLIGALNACPEAALHIAGHADASGNTRRNLDLSRSRARAVAAYMVDKGIDAGRLAAVGYGETRPVAPNTTAANRAKNRRIEVGITARDAPVPPMPVRKQGTRNGLSDR